MTVKVDPNIADVYPFLGSHAIGILNPDGSFSAVSAANPLPTSATFSGSITATNPSVGLTGQPVPTSATAIGWDDGSGNLQVVSAGNPLPISGTINASNPSVGSNNATAPTSDTLIGSVDGSGKMQAASVSNPIPSKLVDSGGVNVCTVTSGNALKVDGSSVTQPISASSLPLPTGAAKESGGNLATIATNIPAQGQALAAASMPVVLTAAQITTLTPPAAITNYANETGGNLAAIKADVDKIPSQGQALAAASMPVVLTAAQITTLTPPAAITNFAKETGGNLATLATNVPAQGQALAAASMPVVLTAAQISTLTPLATVAVDNDGVSNSSLVTWTSATSTGTAANLISGNQKYSNLIVTLLAGSATITGSPYVTFQVSNDNSNWVAWPYVMPSGAIKSNGLLTIPSTANGYYAYVLNISGWQYARLLLGATAFSGSGQVTIGYAASTMPSGVNLSGTALGLSVGLCDAYGTGVTLGQPASASTCLPVALPIGQQVTITQTSPWGVGPSNGTPQTASWNNATSLNTAVNMFSGTSPMPALIGVQFDQTTTITAGAVTVEVSYDNGNNYVTAESWRVLTPATFVSAGNPYTFQASTNYPLYLQPLGVTQIRLRLSTAILGSGAVNIYYQLIGAPAVCTVSGIYNSSAPTLTNGQSASLQLDSSANLKTVVSNGALETGGNLATIATNTGKIPSQGQALAAASLPVVLTAAQITTLTPPAAITNYANETGGNLATLAGAVTSSVVQENVKQINGVTVLMGNGVSGTGSQRVNIASDNTAFSVNATCTNAGTFAVQATLGAETTKVIGTVRCLGNAGAIFDGVPNNSTIPANALQVGCLAATALPTANTATYLTVPMTDKFGRQVVLGASIRDLTAAQATTITASTSITTVIAAGGSGVYTDITNLTITNSSATALIVTLTDGTSNYIYALAANGGIEIPFGSTPLPAASANTVWQLTCGTSVSSIYVVAQYVKNK
jgi:hypothetical protein